MRVVPAVGEVVMCDRLHNDLRAHSRLRSRSGSGALAGCNHRVSVTGASPPVTSCAGVGAVYWVWQASMSGVVNRRMVMATEVDL